MNLAAQNVSYRLGRRTLVANADIAISAGCLTVIAGRNGAGKTTLLRLLAGRLQPGSGRVVINGDAMAALSVQAAARRRAVLPQHDGLNEAFTVDEVLGFSVLPFEGRLAAGEFARRVDEVMQHLEIAHLHTRLYLGLSGGERQRVRLARVILQALFGTGAGPCYLLLDEPLTSLDVVHCHRLMRYLRQLAGTGLGIAAVLHDLNAARRYADQVCLLRDGAVYVQGDADQVLNRDELRAVFGIEVELIETSALPCPVIAVR